MGHLIDNFMGIFGVFFGSVILIFLAVVGILAFLSPIFIYLCYSNLNEIKTILQRQHRLNEDQFNLIKKLKDSIKQ